MDSKTPPGAMPRYLRVAKIDVENNLLYIRGAVPGGRNGLVVVRFSRNGKRGE